eukprot:Rmarinus@m.15962
MNSRDSFFIVVGIAAFCMCSLILFMGTLPESERRSHSHEDPVFHPKLTQVSGKAWMPEKADVPASRHDRPEWIVCHEQLKTHASKLEDKEVGMILLGDSITEGWTEKRFCEKGYYEFQSGAQQILEDRFGDLKPETFAIAADQTQHLLWRIMNDELGMLQPQVYVVLIGTNNVRAGMNAGQVTKGILAIVHELRARSPSAHILIVGLLPRGDAWKLEDPSHIAQEAKLMHDINSRVAVEISSMAMTAQQQVSFVSCWDWFLTSPWKASSEDPPHISKLLLPDSLHPGVAGYLSLADCIRPEVDAFFSQPVVTLSPNNVAGIPQARPLSYVGWHQTHEEYKTSIEFDAREFGVVFVGDGYVEGWQGKRRGKRDQMFYPEVADLFFSEFGDYRPGAFGFSGDQTQHLFWRLQDHELGDAEPRAIVLSVGDANIANDLSGEWTAEAIEVIVTWLLERFPRTQVILSSLFPAVPPQYGDVHPKGAARPPGWKSAVRHNPVVRLANDGLHDFSKRTDRVVFANCWENFIIDADEGFWESSEDYMPDPRLITGPEHLTYEGYHVWAACLHDALSETFR